MIPMYVMLRALLSAVKAVFAAKAARLEKRYTKAALAAETLSKQLTTKTGNGQQDPFATARSHYEFGRLVETRDRLEEKFLIWQGRAETLALTLKNLAEMKGRLIPYLCGAVDFCIVLTALHLLGFPHGLTVESVKSWVHTIVG